MLHTMERRRSVVFRHQDLRESVQECLDGVGTGRVEASNSGGWAVLDGSGDDHQRGLAERKADKLAAFDVHEKPGLGKEISAKNGARNFSQPEGMGQRH